jgi:hypothetical protein
VTFAFHSADPEDSVSDQQCFGFAHEEASNNADSSIAELSINQKLRQMQSMPSGPEQDAAAQEILDWTLENS